MRDAKPLADAPDAAAKARARQAMAVLSSIEARAVVFVDGVFAPELSDLADLEAGLTIGSMAQGARVRRSASSLRIWASSSRPTTWRSRSIPLSWVTAR